MEMKPDLNEFIGKMVSGGRLFLPVRPPNGPGCVAAKSGDLSRLFYKGLPEHLVDVVNKDNLDILKKIVREILQVGLIFLG